MGGGDQFGGDEEHLVQVERAVQVGEQVWQCSGQENAAHQRKGREVVELVHFYQVQVDVFEYM